MMYGYAMVLNLNRLNPHFGAEITGLDLADGFSDETFGPISQAFIDFGLVVIRDHELSMPDQVDLGRRFGEVQIHVMDQYQRDDYPEIYFLTNLDDDGNPSGAHPDQGTLYWHTDGSWRDRTGQATIMVADEVPAVGGETHFCCMEAAYNALDEATKRQISNLRSVHSLDFSRNRRHAHDPLTEAQKSAIPPVAQPVTRIHPLTGRKSLFLGDHAEYIEGMDYADGRRFIDELNDRAVRPEFVYAHTYRTGDVVIWDNRRLLHKSTPYDTATERRVMRRTTVLGDVPA